MIRVLVLLLLLPSMGFAESVPEEEPEAEAPPKDAPMMDEVTEVRPITGRNCYGKAKPTLGLSQVIGIKYGDWGLEHQMRIGACIPLVIDKGPLFDLSFFEAGMVLHTSPIYVMPGGYINVAPLSILQFRVEAAPIFYWPIGVSAAGYFPIPGYSSDYSKASLPAEDGETALGWYVRFGPTLQIAFPIGPLKLIFVDSAFFEHWQIGEADYYFHNRNDLPAANSEWMVDQSALLLVEIPVHPNASLRFGAQDQLLMNFGGKNISNAIRGVAMINLKRLGPKVRDFSPILAIGGRTHHPVRGGHFNFIVALSFKADLLAKKGE